MAQFDWAVKLAADLIKPNGEAGLLIIKAASIDDPEKPWEGGEGVETDYDVTVLWLNTNLQDAGTGLMPPDNEQHTEIRKVLIAGSNLPGVVEIPSGSRIVRANGMTFTVHKTKRVEPNGQQILFTGYVYR